MIRRMSPATATPETAPTPAPTLRVPGLWFATGIVHRHTQSPYAAALFAALVQGWAFAAWFVTI